MRLPRSYWKGRHVVYRLFEGGRLLYVGRTVDLARRIVEHRQAAWWFTYVTRVQLQVFPTEAAADAAERKAIADEGPAFNQMYTGRSWRSQHNWLPIDHQRHREHETAVWAAFGKNAPAA